MLQCEIIENVSRFSEDTWLLAERFNRRTNRCGRPGPHFGVPWYTVLSAAPAAERGRSAVEGFHGGNRPDVPDCVRHRRVGGGSDADPAEATRAAARRRPRGPGAGRAE